MESDFIIINEYCEKCDVEPSFILLLEEAGLINVELVENKKCIETSQLGSLDMFFRLYYELSINIEGIDVINNLLNRVAELKKEIDLLQNRLSIYEPSDLEIIDV